MGVAPKLWIKAEIVRGETVGVWLLPEPATDCSSGQRLCVERDGAKGIVGLKRLVSYSYLKAIIGSTRIALRAGM